MKTKPLMKVFRNDLFVGYCDNNQKSRKNFLSFVRIGTHMGEWKKIDGDAPTSYEYHTTVGVTVKFIPETWLEQSNRQTLEALNVVERVPMRWNG